METTDIVTIDLKALLDSPAMESLIARLTIGNKNLLPPINVYALDLLRSWESVGKTALCILVPKKLEKHSLAIKNLLEFKSPYEAIRIVVYDNRATYQIYLNKSSYHITSSIINLFSNPHRNTGMITDYLSYIPLQLFCKRIRHFRVHFFGFFNILSHLPIFLPIFCLFVNIIKVHNISPELVTSFFQVQRGLLAGAYLFIAAADNLASMMDIPYQRRKFYLEQLTPTNSQEFIQDYTSKELVLVFLGICLIAVIVLCFFLNPLGIFGSFLLGIFSFISHTWAWYFKYPLRILATLLVSFCLQFKILIRLF